MKHVPSEELWPPPKWHEIIVLWDDILRGPEYPIKEIHYAWQLLQSPDYRLGQAFLNYFPKISKLYLEDGDRGENEEYRLFNETDAAKAQTIINKWIFNE